MQKIVKLSLHKNTLEQRRRKELKAAAVAAVKSAFDTIQGDAIMIVVLNKDQTSVSFVDSGPLRPAEFSLLVRDELAGLTCNGKLTETDEAEGT